MVPELLLGLVLTASAGGIYFLIKQHVREKQAREEERLALTAQFKQTLLRTLRSTKASDFRFSEFVDRCGVSRRDADRVTDEIFRSLYRSVMADGVVTNGERKKLVRLASTLEIEEDRSARIEQEIKGEVYCGAVEGVLADGVVTEAEVLELEALRKSLGICRKEALEISESLSRDAYLATLRRIVEDGHVTEEEKAELAKVKCALAISSSDGARLAQWGNSAIDLYRQLFTSIIQDGVVTPEQESALTWFQGEVGLPDSWIAASQERLQKVKRLSAYREGNLPSIRTKIILQSSEVCHWEGPCSFRYQTTRQVKSLDGDLLVTSKNVIIKSQIRTISYSPSRMLDIIRYSGSLAIQVNGSQGTGSYFVSDPEELEAVLTGLVRKHKYLLGEKYTSSMSRRIAHEVKIEVWARDGGRCVGCGASDYLEFDHIIPHSRGGASTVNNVQLLCRRCNSEKSDRI